MKKPNTKKDRTSNCWCKCGYRKRGDNHEEGDHHKNGKK